MHRTRLMCMLAALASALSVGLVALQSSPAHAVGSFTHHGCTVTFRAPLTRFTDFYGPEMVDGETSVMVDGCENDETTTICYDYQYRRNGSWGGWNNASRSDSLRAYRNGCLNIAGDTGPGGDWAASYSFAQQSYYMGLYPAECSKFQAVRIRASAWVRTDEGFSAAYRGSKESVAYC